MRSRKKRTASNQRQGETVKEKNGEHPLGDAGQLMLLGVFLIVWVGDSFFLRTSTFLSGYVPLYIRLAVLVVAVACAVALVRSGHVVVSGEERPSTIVSSGAFRYVRHPLYLGSILAYVGLAVSTLSLFSVLVLAGMLVFYDYSATYEERLMEARFGADYSAYKEKTGKWLPRGIKQGDPL
jgi:protein-S-isoprenylcysteine O-methyltransferase Ste14